LLKKIDKAIEDAIENRTGAAYQAVMGGQKA
jgi:hypothetical protein